MARGEGYPEKAIHFLAKQEGCQQRIQNRKRERDDRSVGGERKVLPPSQADGADDRSDDPENRELQKVAAETSAGPPLPRRSDNGDQQHRRHDHGQHGHRHRAQFLRRYFVAGEQTGPHQIHQDQNQEIQHYAGSLRKLPASAYIAIMFSGGVST